MAFLGLVLAILLVLVVLEVARRFAQRTTAMLSDLERLQRRLAELEVNRCHDRSERDKSRSSIDARLAALEEWRDTPKFMATGASVEGDGTLKFTVENVGDVDPEQVWIESVMLLANATTEGAPPVMVGLQVDHQLAPVGRQELVRISLAAPELFANGIQALVSMNGTAVMGGRNREINFVADGFDGPAV